MTLYELVLARWRKATAVPDSRTRDAPVERPSPRVPAAYLSLYTYLERRYASVVVLTFEQMEALLGFTLPEPASTDRDWWTGVGVRIDRHSDAWLGAGRTALPNLLARTVTFERRP